MVTQGSRKGRQAELNGFFFKFKMWNSISSKVAEFYIGHVFITTQYSFIEQAIEAYQRKLMKIDIPIRFSRLTINNVFSINTQFTFWDLVMAIRLIRLYALLDCFDQYSPRSMFSTCLFKMKDTESSKRQEYLLYFTIHVYSSHHIRAHWQG